MHVKLIVLFTALVGAQWPISIPTTSMQTPLNLGYYNNVLYSAYVSSATPYSITVQAYNAVTGASLWTNSQQLNNMATQPDLQLVAYNPVSGNVEVVLTLKSSAKYTPVSTAVTVNLVNGDT